LFVIIETKDIVIKYTYSNYVIVISLIKPTPNDELKENMSSIGIRKGLVLGVHLLCDEHVSFEMSIILMIYHHMLGMLKCHRFLITCSHR